MGLHRKFLSNFQESLYDYRSLLWANPLNFGSWSYSLVS